MRNWRKRGTLKKVEKEEKIDEIERKKGKREETKNDNAQGSSLGSERGKTQQKKKMSI